MACWSTVGQSQAQSDTKKRMVQGSGHFDTCPWEWSIICSLHLAALPLLTRGDQWHQAAQLRWELLIYQHSSHSSTDEQNADVWLETTSKPTDACAHAHTRTHPYVTSSRSVALCYQPKRSENLCIYNTHNHENQQASRESELMRTTASPSPAHSTRTSS